MVIQVFRVVDVCRLLEVSYVLLASRIYFFVCNSISEITAKSSVFNVKSGTYVPFAISSIHELAA